LKTSYIQGCSWAGAVRSCDPNFSQRRSSAPAVVWASKSKSGWNYI